MSAENATPHAAIPRDPSLSLALRTTLVTLVLTGYGAWPLHLPLTALAVVALLLPRLSRMPILWFACGSLLGLHLIAEWPRPDNHIYLLAYWCFALSFSLWSAEPGRRAAASARWLIGLAFALALVWKVVLSPDFLNGTFFHVMFVSDPRFIDIGIWLGGLDEGAWQSGREISSALASGQAVVDLPSSDRLVMWARVFTAWTIAIEAWIAIAFLAPQGSRPGRSGSAALALFVVTTYALVTVEGFGWTLVAMAMAQIPEAHQGSRRAAVALYIAVLVYHLAPWPDLIRAIATGQ